MSIDKVLKKLPMPVQEEMGAASNADLEKIIVQSETAIADARRELDANPAYVQAKENVKDLSAGFRDLSGYQRAKIAYALHLIRERSVDNA